MRNFAAILVCAACTALCSFGWAQSCPAPQPDVTHLNLSHRQAALDAYRDLCAITHTPQTQPKEKLGGAEVDEAGGLDTLNPIWDSNAEIAGLAKWLATYCPNQLANMSPQLEQYSDDAAKVQYLTTFKSGLLAISQKTHKRPCD